MRSWVDMRVFVWWVDVGCERVGDFGCGCEDGQVKNYSCVLTHLYPHPHPQIIILLRHFFKVSIFFYLMILNSSQVNGCSYPYFL